MRSKGIKKIPCPTLRRLPDYYNIFSSAMVQEQEYISSIEISNFLGIDHTQVRKDMAFIGFSGKPKVGFEVRSFVSYFNKKMELKRKKKAVLIGAGNLGIAIARYDGFVKYGLEVCGVFDSDISKIGLKVRDREILSIAALPEFVKKEDISIAILTVPAEYAQEVAESLSDTAIKAIWNFSSVHLKVRKGVIVWNQDLAASFLNLSLLMEK